MNHVVIEQLYSVNMTNCIKNYKYKGYTDCYDNTVWLAACTDRCLSSLFVNKLFAFCITLSVAYVCVLLSG